MMIPRAGLGWMAALGLVLAMGTGCDSSKSKGGGSTPRVEAVDTTVSDHVHLNPEPPEASWQTDADPLSILAVTGQQNGYLEPCGCTEGQTGGLGRRFTMLKEMRDEAPMVAIDLGGLIEDPEKSRGGADQTRIKLQMALKALATMKYDAMALAPSDLELGLADFFGQYLNTPEAPALLAANVKPGAGLESTLLGSTVKEAGGKRFGITAVVDPAALEKIPEEDRVGVLEEILDPTAALQGIWPELAENSDVQVLMVQGPVAMARELAAAFPEFEVVVATSEYVDPPVEPEALNDGKTMLVQVGQKGQNVGFVGLFDEAQTPLRYRRERLDASYENAPEMQMLIDEDYTKALANQNVVGNYPRFPHPSGAQYVGAETCKKCHPATYDFWTRSRHAHAYDAIVYGKRGNRTMDAECVSCHVTGFGYESGFQTAEATPYLKSQQCENCHGPGSHHVAEPDNPEYRKEVTLTADFADKSGLCVRCHDADNDPHYDFKLRWAAVAHKGLDTYASPRVHQGLDVESILQSLRAAETAAE